VAGLAAATVFNGDSTTFGSTSSIAAQTFNVYGRFDDHDHHQRGVDLRVSGTDAQGFVGHAARCLLATGWSRRSGPRRRWRWSVRRRWAATTTANGCSRRSQFEAAA
jgi:hypothetical protein